MENNNTQLELFTQASDGSGASRIHDHAFLKAIKAYERSIIVIIGIALTGIVAFSLGVERGKRQSASKSTSSPELAVTPKSPSAAKKPQAQAAPRNLPAVSLPTRTTPDSVIDQVSARTGYTIQLASYKTKLYAQKEAEALKRKGFDALILSKKGFSVLCVGTFINKQTAAAQFSKLQKKYKGCYIRRL
jgi:cell division protein FtsN